MSEKNIGPSLTEFPPHTYEQWKEAAEKLLKGASFEKKLLTKTHEGITLMPLYRKEDVKDLLHLNGMPGSGNLVRSNCVSGYVGKSWEVSQELDVKTAKEFNSVAKNALMRGQTEINMVLDLAGRMGLDPDVADENAVGMKGTSIATVNDIKIAFSGIDLENTPLFIKGRIGNFVIFPMVVKYMKEVKQNPKKLRGAIALDPLGVLSKSGDIPLSLERVYDILAAHYAHVKNEAPELQSIMVCTNTYHDGGASATQELSYALSTASEYIRAIQSRTPNVDINDLVASIRFSMGIGGNYFMEIAKFRAFRLLWSKVAKAFGANENSIRKSFLFAKSASWNKTVYDPYVNMLRGTTEAFSAVVGGVNGLHVAPFDAPIRPSDEFSRRIARNVQIILAEECEMTKVIDPAGGSWYIESLTDQVARASWEEFKKIEKIGGMYLALKEGVIQKNIEIVANEKIGNFAKRKEVLVGSNMYPNATEELLKAQYVDYKALKELRATEVKSARSNSDEVSKKLDEIKNGKFSEVLVSEAVDLGASYGEIFAAIRDTSRARVLPIRERRVAEIYEELRNAANVYKNKSGNAPLIFQANLGPSRFYRGRADWTQAFFQAGGFEVSGDRDFDSVDEAVATAISKNARIVVLTSTDEKYVEVVADFARALKAKDNSILLIVAGVPGENEKNWMDAGVDKFVNVLVNNYEMNRDLLTHIGVL